MGRMASSEMADTLHWLGHASFRWAGSKTVYFDPYQLAAGAARADIICISHEHFDHCSPDDIAAIATKETVVVASADAAAQLLAARLACKEVKALTAGETFEVEGVTITAVASYNTNKSFHTRESGKVGFVVKMDGMTVYHAGDTDVIPEMKEIHPDVALLPVSGTYVMTADEAAQAARTIKPMLAIPMHYGAVAGSPADAERFKKDLAGTVEVLIPKKEK